jgi:hypothetical protein
MYTGEEVIWLSLIAEYESGSEVFLHKVERLEHKYSHLRRTRSVCSALFRVSGSTTCSKVVDDPDNCTAGGMGTAGTGPSSLATWRI